MVFLTQIVLEDKFWETPDPTKMGYIPVYFKNEVRLAKPILNPFELKIPSKEFISKYGKSMGIYVYKDPETSVLWWTGFCLYKNQTLLQEFNDDYPYIRINHMDEKWLEYFSSVAGKEAWEVKYTGEGDYSSIRMDVGNKIMTINNRSINGIQFDKDRTVLLEKQEMLLGGFEATEPAILGNKMQTWLEDLVDAVNTQTHSNGFNGLPTGTPLNAAVFSALKTRIPEILSELIKISK